MPRRRRTKKKSAGLNSKQIATVKKIIAKNTSSELYHHDHTLNVTNLSGFTNLADLTIVTQGNNDTDRQGDKIMMKSLFARFSLENLDAAENHNVRVVVYQNLEDNLTGNLDLTDLLQNSTTMSTDINSYYQLDKHARFKVLYDKMFALPFAGQPGSLRNIKIAIPQSKFAMKNIEFTNTASSGVGKLFMLYCSTGGLNDVELKGHTRLRYYP